MNEKKVEFPFIFYSCFLSLFNVKREFCEILLVLIVLLSIDIKFMFSLLVKCLMAFFVFFFFL